MNVYIAECRTIYLPKLYAVPKGLFVQVNQVCNNAPVYINTHKSVRRKLCRKGNGFWRIGAKGSGACAGGTFVTSGGQNKATPDGPWGGDQIQVNCSGN